MHKFCSIHFHIDASQHLTIENTDLSKLFGKRELELRVVIFCHTEYTWCPNLSWPTSS